VTVAPATASAGVTMASKHFATSSMKTRDALSKVTMSSFVLSARSLPAMPLPLLAPLLALVLSLLLFPAPCAAQGPFSSSGKARPNAPAAAWRRFGQPAFGQAECRRHLWRTFGKGLAVKAIWGHIRAAGIFGLGDRISSQEKVLQDVDGVSDVDFSIVIPIGSVLASWCFIP
jgi:hypothetical protein